MRAAPDLASRFRANLVDVVCPVFSRPSCKEDGCKRDGYKEIYCKEDRDSYSTDRFNCSEASACCSKDGGKQDST